MEVIKIPGEHVDACLFFRPGGGGRAGSGGDAAPSRLSASRTEGRVWEREGGSAQRR